MNLSDSAVDGGDLNLSVTVRRHRYDFQSLAEDVGHRIEATVLQAPHACHYFNPAVTVSCSHQTDAFFRTIRREQARWCRVASQTFRKRQRRRVRVWVASEPFHHKHARYLNRTACLTGILFMSGRLVPNHQWRDCHLDVG